MNADRIRVAMVLNARMVLTHTLVFVAVVSTAKTVTPKLQLAIRFRAKMAQNVSIPRPQAHLWQWTNLFANACQASMAQYVMGT